MALQTFVNTRYFREAAIHFQKHGCYTKAPFRSKDYYEFWQEETKRCLHGYKVGGLSITGKHYFYLNYFPIMKTKEDGTPEKMDPKELQFPSFWEVDYYWWWAKEIAQNGAKKEFVDYLGIPGLPIVDYTSPKHLVCLKTRRAGFSYKEACDAIWNYNFVPRSKSYFFASNSEYLTVDGILNKVQTGLDFLNEHTQQWWLRNRKKKNLLMHQKASYIDDFGNERGYLSEIIGTIIDNPNKVRGKDGIKITYEEAGSFKDLKKALAISLPSVKQGNRVTGQISVFGTGGEEGPAIEGLEEIFKNPLGYDMLAFQNIWEEGYEHTECGLFVPCYMTYEDFFDMDGNIDVEAALTYDDTERVKKASLPDPKELDRRKAEFPRTPSEALQRLSGNDFPIAAVQEQLRRLETQPLLNEMIRYGFLDRFEDGTVRFRPRVDGDPTPVNMYPHKKSKDGKTGNASDTGLEGCITIFERPEKDEMGRVLQIYQIVVDPYYTDQAKDTTSLGVIYVFKQESKLSATSGDKLVASYVGRPNDLDNFYKYVFLLADYYDCMVQSEIAGGGEGIKGFARYHGFTHRLCFEPETLNNKEVNTSLRNRSIFMVMSTDRKRVGLALFINWCKQIRGYDENGKPILNVHRIYDKGFLEEMVKFNDEGNFDRISAGIIWAYMRREYNEKTIKELTRTPDTTFDRPWFGHGYDDDNSLVTLV